MKKIWVFIVLSALFVSGIIAYVAYHYYAPPQLKQPYKIPQPDDTLRIAYIGDSWAFMHKDHNCQISQLIEDSIHRPVKVHSYGICGLTSKEIYENLFDNSDLKHFFQKRGYEYCFVSAGINDTYKKMSTTYYQQSMDAIIQFLLYNNIHPIILEIPDYNIQKSYERQKKNRKMLRHLSMLINNTPMDCKLLFRNALDELLHEKGYENKVNVIRYKTWNNDYANDLRQLYRPDGMHLNEKGYADSDSTIVKVILDNLCK